MTRQNITYTPPIIKIGPAQPPPLDVHHFENSQRGGGGRMKRSDYEHGDSIVTATTKS
jgi:hypothetical protein